jgi:hypothetical protein
MPRLCVHILADRKTFAPQDLAALLITLDLGAKFLATAYSASARA